MSLFALKKETNHNIRPVDRNAAVEQLMIFLNYYHIDLMEISERIAKKKGESVAKEISELADADQFGLTLCASIEKGWLSISEENGAPLLTQHLYNSIGDITCITYGPVNGKIRRILAGGLPERRGYDIAAECCMQTKAVLDKLQSVDGQNFEIVANNFFQLV